MESLEILSPVALVLAGEQRGRHGESVFAKEAELIQMLLGKAQPPKFELQDPHSLALILPGLSLIMNETHTHTHILIQLPLHTAARGLAPSLSCLTHFPMFVPFSPPVPPGRRPYPL